MDIARRQAWIRYYIPSYLYAGFIFALSSYSFVAPPSLPSFSDKVVHFLEYVILGLLLSRSYSNANTKSLKRYFIFLVFFTGLACGFFDEYYQSFVPERNFEVLDLVSDMAGVSAGLILYALNKIRH